MDDHYRKLIAAEFENCVTRTISRINGSKLTYRPFHSALLSEEAIHWSGFERSFSTSFGQRVIEELAKLVALSNGAQDACRQKDTIISIDTAYEEAIHDHIQHLRSENRNYRYDWESSLREVKSAIPSGRKKKIKIISDMWWKKDGIDHFISLKTVKPNIDQTTVAKEDCLRLSVAMPTCKAYFGLPYNPYGEDKASYAFNPPMRIFDFHHDKVVLIGKEMWDTIGGDGCYEELLDIVAEVGLKTKEAIDRSRAKRMSAYQKGIE